MSGASSHLSTKICKECSFEIPKAARRCGHCGSVQNAWKRAIIQWSGLFSAILLIIPIWQIAVTLPRYFLGPSNIGFRAVATVCSFPNIEMKVHNLSTDDYLIVEKVYLRSLTDAPKPTSGRYIVLPFLGENLRGDDLVPPTQRVKMKFEVPVNRFALKEEACGSSCSMTFAVLASDLKGGPTRAWPASCTSNRSP